MKVYAIFTGVNGVGKTSIYKSIYSNENKDEKRVNTDEMVAEAIEKRYVESLVDLNSVIDMCDKINIYDNIEMLKIVMSIEKAK